MRVSTQIVKEQSALPVDVEAHLGSDVPEPDVVFVVDHVGGELCPLAVNVDGAVASSGGEPCGGCLGPACECYPGQNANAQGTAQAKAAVLSSTTVHCVPELSLP